MNDDSDPFHEPISNELNRELMHALMRLPAVLQKQLEGDGDEGPVTVPPEQLLEALQASFWILLRYVPKIATQLDVLKGEVRALEKRLDDAG